MPDAEFARVLAVIGGCLLMAVAVTEDWKWRRRR